MFYCDLLCDPEMPAFSSDWAYGCACDMIILSAIIRLDLEREVFVVLLNCRSLVLKYVNL